MQVCQIGAPHSALLWGSALGLTRKYQTSLKKLDKHKRSSLFCLIVSDEEKSFMTLTPGCKGCQLASQSSRTPSSRTCL
jgi:hypothetical protein